MISASMCIIFQSCSCLCLSRHCSLNLLHSFSRDQQCVPDVAELPTPPDERGSVSEPCGLDVHPEGEDGCVPDVKSAYTHPSPSGPQEKDVTADHQVPGESLTVAEDADDNQPQPSAAVDMEELVTVGFVLVTSVM